MYRHSGGRCCASLHCMAAKVVIVVYISNIIYVLVIICPIAIAYSMGQIIKSVCICQSVCVCICPSASTLMVAFLDGFSPQLAQT